MFEEFKKFALRGNVVDLAVAVIIGVAFGAIVTSLVNDIIMPLIGAITGGLDFSNYYTALSSKVQPSLSYADAKKQGAVLGWGQFLTLAINFLIIAWVLFLAIKGHKQIEKRRASSARSWADTRGKAAHRNSRLAEKRPPSAYNPGLNHSAIRQSLTRHLLNGCNRA
jgi:large conductance mechanosensitive channel